MELKYKGKTAIVTGASGGMGIEVTKELLKRKIKILMLDIKNPPKNFDKKNKYVFFNKIDLTNFNQLKKIIDIFYKKHGSIDYLINTTGVLWFGKDISVVDIDFKVWDQVFLINLKIIIATSSTKI